MSREIGVLAQSSSQAAVPPPPCPDTHAKRVGAGASIEKRVGRFMMTEQAVEDVKSRQWQTQSKLSIGIQIRLPDSAEGGSLLDDSEAGRYDVSDYFRCAQQIEDEQRCRGQEVIW